MRDEDVRWAEGFDAWGCSSLLTISDMYVQVESGSEGQSEWQRARLAAQLSLLRQQMASCLHPQSMFHTRVSICHAWAL